MVGLLVMIGGIYYLSHYQTWLVEAKKELLRTQGELIAAAIASDARIEQGNIEINLEQANRPDKSRVPYRDDGFSSLQLSIRPERATPILRRLIQHTKNRARIYGRDGTLIVDTATLLTKGQLTRPAADQEPVVKPKNFWTRLTSVLIDKHLPVYKEIGNAKGTAYPEVRAALDGTATPLLLLDQDGEQIVSMAVPIRRANAVLGALLLSTRPGDIEKSLSQERWRIALLAVIALVATLVSSLLLARTVAEPIRRLSEAAEEVSRNINARAHLPDFAERNDEVGQLSRAFRSMTAALYRRIELSESFAADVAHELKNPLTAARSTAESLVYAKTPEQRDELVRQIQNELKRLNRLITDVSNASRLDAELARQAMVPTLVTDVVDNVAKIFRDILSEDGRSVRVVLDQGVDRQTLKVTGHEGRMGQVITNLVDNAVSFSPAGRRGRDHREADAAACGHRDRRRGARHSGGSSRHHLRPVLYGPAAVGGAARQEFGTGAFDLARDRDRAWGRDLGREPAGGRLGGGQPPRRCAVHRPVTASGHDLARRLGWQPPLLKSWCMARLSRSGGGRRCCVGPRAAENPILR